MFFKCSICHKFVDEELIMTLRTLPFMIILCMFPQIIETDRYQSILTNIIIPIMSVILPLRWQYISLLPKQLIQDCPIIITH